MDQIPGLNRNFIGIEPVALSDEILHVGYVESNPFRHIKNYPCIQYPRHSEAFKLGIDTSTYYAPARGPLAETASLVSQHRGVVPVATPPLLQEAIDVTAALYPQTADPWRLLHNRAYWEQLLQHVNPSANPGHPLAQLKSTNFGVLADSELLNMVVAMTIDRIIRLSQTDPEELTRRLEEDPLWAIRTGLADVHRMFIKKEPHPVRKVPLEAWRIIIMLSLVDNLVERFLFTTQDTAELGKWADLPSKCGSGLTDDDAVKLAEYVKLNFINLATDAKGWDIHAPEYLLKAEISVRRKLNHGCKEWYNAAMNVAVITSRRVSLTSDGKLLIRVTPGGQSSGKKTTSSGNSRMRTLLHVLVSLHYGFPPGVMAQGDDCCERLPENISIPDYQAYVKTLGVNIKFAERCSSDDFGFCSQQFLNAGAVVIPEHPEKAIAKFLYDTPTNVYHEALESMRINFRHADSKWVDLCANHAGAAFEAASKLTKELCNSQEEKLLTELEQSSL